MTKIYLKILIFIVVMISVTLVFGSIQGKVSSKPISAVELPILASNLMEGSVQSSSGIGLDLSEENIVKAPIYGVYSLNGERYAGIEESKRWPIASLTKLMTAVIAREVIPANDRIKITEEILGIEDIGMAGGFSANGVFNRLDLEEALLIISSNVAAEALARHYGREKFIDTMNSFAFRIGMANTYFEDPTGLSYKDQSTVEDLNKLVAYIFRNAPDILKTTRS